MSITCNVCQSEHPASVEFFYVDKRASTGFSLTCKACVKHRARQWRQENRDRKARTDKAYAQRNAEKISKYQREYRMLNREKASEYHAEYRKMHCDRLRKARAKYHSNPKVKDRRNEKSRIRRARDAKFKLTCNMRTAISERMSGKRIGCIRHVEWTIEELMVHLEKQFLPGMTWDNYGEWHVDHIVPAASFSYKSPSDADFKACWHLGNLRPLWAKDNCSKQDRIDYII